MGVTTGLLLACSISAAVTVWQCQMKHETCLQTVFAVLSAVFFLLTLPRAYIGSAVPFLQLAVVVLCYMTHVCILMHYSSPPQMWRKGDWATFLISSLVVSVTHQGYARDLLPRWPARIIIAEVYTITKWASVQVVRQSLTTKPPWQLLLSFLLSQVSGVITPMLLFPDKPLPQHTKHPPPAHQASPSPPSSASSPSRSSDPSAAPATTPPRDHAPPPDDLAVTESAPLSPLSVLSQSQASRWHGLGLTPLPSGPTTQQPPYESVLGRRHTISIKVATQHHPEHLGPGALSNLARAVEAHSRSDPYIVLSVATRRGCILLHLDTCQPSTPTSPASTITSEDAMTWARQLLPALPLELGLVSSPDQGCDADAAFGRPQEGSAGDCMQQALLQPGQYLQLQLGGQTVRAACDPETRTWVFESAPVAAAPHGALVCARVHPAGMRHSHSRNTAKHGMHTVRFSVSVVRTSALEYLFVRGTDPAGSTADSSDKPAWQLWVQCQGVYLRTDVEQVDPYTGLVQAVVEVPEVRLARHHTDGGPAARVQLLTAELWDGAEQLLSRTPVFVDAVQHMQPPAATGSFGWWGADSGVVASVLAELGVLAQSLSQYGLSSTAAVNHQAFASDLMTWLEVVQHTVPAVTCCRRAAPSRHQTAAPQLPAGQRAALAQCLLQHATACELTSTVAMLRAQSLLLSRATQPCTPALTSACHVCDGLYHGWLHARLHSAGLWVNCLVAFLTAVKGPYFFNSSWSSLVVRVAFSVRAAICVLMALRKAKLAHPHSRRVLHAATRTLLDSGALYLMAWVLHIAIEPRATGSYGVPMSGPLPFMLSHQALCLIGHQAQVWGRVPTWLLGALLVAETVMHYLALRNVTFAVGWVWRVWHIVGVTAVPLAMSLYWRSLFRQACLQKPKAE